MKLQPFARNYVRFMFAPASDAGLALAPPPPPPGPNAPPAAPPPPKGETPPPKKETPPADPPADELADFKNPSLDLLGSADDDKQLEPPPADPPPKKPDDKKPDDQKSALDDPKAPAQLLRDELKRTREERDALKKQVDDHPKVKELSEAIAAKQAEFEALDTRYKEAQERVNLLDPLSHEDLKTLSEDFNAAHKTRMDDLPQIERDYKQLVLEYEALPRDDREKYGELQNAFRKQVAELVGAENVPEAMAAIRKGIEFRQAYAKKETELKSTAGKTIFEKRQKQYENSYKATEEHLKGALDIEPDVLEAHPFHPLGFLKNGIESLDDAGKKAEADYDGKVQKYIKFAANGVSPKGMAELDALPPKERTERLQQMETDRMQAARWVRQMAFRAAKYERWLSGMLADYAKLREAAGKKRDALPPDPTKKVDDDKKGDKNLTLEGYQAPVDELSAI